MPERIFEIALLAVEIVPLLLRWFERHARDLPWRRTRNPYAIWVSEIMLQQTQVKTVLPYWVKWMKALPNVHALASTKLETIHKLWEGLGYYTRVRNLHKAAQLIVADYDGNFPEEYAAVLELPGVGRYTAGAICSIAFNQPAPVLDGNVTRVLTRVFAIPGNPRDRKVDQELWELAEELVQYAGARTRKETPRPPRRLARTSRKSGSCSELNQALMELGALICTARQPRCTACPLATRCRALRQPGARS